MHEGFSLKTPAQLSAALFALRELDKVLGKPKEPKALVERPREHPCAACEKRYPMERMHVIPVTSLVKNVTDCFCQSCYDQHRKDLDRMARIVCATCRETVLVLEPHKEQAGGFVWAPGSFAHVAVCPVCADENLPCSPVAEKIAFYKRQGIPYEDPGAKSPSTSTSTTS